MRRDTTTRTTLAALLIAATVTSCTDPESPAVSSSVAIANGSSSGTAIHSAPTIQASAGIQSAAPIASAPTTPPKPAVASAESKKFAASSNAFGLDLYQKLRQAGGNLTISPASLSIAMAMTWGGAQGPTADEMKRVLHFEGAPEEVSKGAGNLSSELQDGSRQVTFKIANRLFGEKSYKFEQAFLDSTKKSYGAAIDLVDFKTEPDAVRGKINGWVEEQTEKRIQNLIPPGAIRPSTRLVLTNAVYFLGDWQQPFKKESTFDTDFHPSKSATIKVPTMHRKGSFNFVAADGMKMLEIPYKGSAMSMVFVLPDSVDGLEALEKGLTAQKLEGWMNGMQPDTVSVALPKFEINPAKSLAVAKVLEDMGMKLAFSPKADFTKMANPANADAQLYITDVFHKAFVKLDEKGTEAAAASAVIMGEKGAAPPQKQTEFVADHPFLFFLRDKASGLVAFMGRVADPSVK